MRVGRVGFSLHAEAQRVYILPILRTLVPKTIPGMVFGTRVLEWAVFGPFGKCPPESRMAVEFRLSGCRLAGVGCVQ